MLSPTVCPLHSADSKAIVDGNLKLILGLIWTLILHYSISMPMWEDEDDEDARKQTPKQRLLGWIQNKVPQLPITNFNRDWQDGKALGALVDNCAPGEWAGGPITEPFAGGGEACACQSGGVRAGGVGAPGGLAPCSSRSPCWCQALRDR